MDSFIQAKKEGKVLVVVVTAYWFGQYQKGVKTEEYRSISEYWEKRLIKHYKGGFKNPVFKSYQYLDIRNGYSNESIIFKIKEICIKKPEKGQAPNDWLNTTMFAIITQSKL